MIAVHPEDVVEERFELVRELNVVNDNAVMAGFFNGNAEVWFPQAEPVAKRSSELVIADNIAGRWNGGGGVGDEADLVSPWFRLGVSTEPQNAQRAVGVIHHRTPPIGSVSHLPGELSNDGPPDLERIPAQAAALDSGRCTQPVIRAEYALDTPPACALIAAPRS